MESMTPHPPPKKKQKKQKKLGAKHDKSWNRTKVNT